MKPEHFPLFEHWYGTVDLILDRCEKYPKDVRFTLANRIAAMALDVVELIREAIYTKKRRSILLRINLNLEKMRLLFRLSEKRRYISVKQYELLIRRINEAGKMTGGWLKSSSV